MIMKNPAIPIKQWLVTQLAAYTYVDVYDAMVPANEPAEYITITGRTSGQEQGKEGYINMVSVNIDITTKSSNFGFKRAEQIADAVMGAVNSDTVVVLPVGWDCKNVVLASVTNLEDLDPFDNTFRVILRYEFIISQTQ
jgi:hypothetical protein